MLIFHLHQSTCIDDTKSAKVNRKYVKALKLWVSLSQPRNIFLYFDEPCDKRFVLQSDSILIHIIYFLYLLQSEFRTNPNKSRLILLILEISMKKQAAKDVLKRRF